jgi:hypothetical protein
VDVKPPTHYRFEEEGDTYEVMLTIFSNGPIYRSKA